MKRVGNFCFWESELEFERFPFMILVTFKDKLSFALASLDKNRSKRDEIERIMYSYISWLIKIKIREAGFAILFINLVESEFAIIYIDRKIPDYR